METHITDPEEVVKAVRAEGAHAQIEDPAPAYGIQETQEALVFVCTLANLAVDWRRLSGEQMLAAVSTLFPVAVPAFVNIGQIPAELGDLSDDERAALVHVVRDTIVLDSVFGNEGSIAPIETSGIEQTVDVSIFLGALVSYVVRYKSFSLASIVSSLTSIAPKLVSALTGIDQIPKELGDLTDSERVAVAGAFAQQFELDNEHIETVSEKGYEILFMFAQLITHIRNVRRTGTADAYEALAVFAFDVVLSIVQLVNEVKPLLDAPAHTE